VASNITHLHPSRLNSLGSFDLESHGDPKEGRLLAGGIDVLSEPMYNKSGVVFDQTSPLATTAHHSSPLFPSWVILLQLRTATRQRWAVCWIGALSLPKSLDPWKFDRDTTGNVMWLCR